MSVLLQVQVVAVRPKAKTRVQVSTVQYSSAGKTGSQGQFSSELEEI